MLFLSSFLKTFSILSSHLFFVKKFLKLFLSFLKRIVNNKIIKSLEGDKIKWSLKIEQNIVNIKPAILLSLIKTQSNLSKTD